MRRLLLCLALLVPLLSCGGDGERKVETLTSPAGHSFAFMEIDEQDVTDITVAIAWPSDWMRRSDVNVVAPYVGADMILNGGTPDLRPEQVLETFNSMNASGSLFATPDYLRGVLSFPKEHRADVVGIANQMLRQPQFTPEWLGRIAGQIADNQAMANAQDSNQLFAAARLAIFGDTPLNTALTIPDANLLRSLTLQDLRDWHQRTVTGNTAVIAVTGAISAGDAGQMIDDLLAGLPDGPADSIVGARMPIPVKSVLLHLPDGAKTTVGLIAPMPPFAEGGTVEDQLAVAVLGQQSGGPLFDVVRTQLRAAYAVNANVLSFDYANRFIVISTEVDTAQTAAAVDALRTAYDGFRTAPDLSGLPEVRKALAANTKETVTYVDGAANVMLESMLTGEIPIADVPKLDAIFEAVTDDEVKARLQAAFPPSSDFLVMVASPDAAALPGACVITAAADILQCP